MYLCVCVCVHEYMYVRMCACVGIIPVKAPEMVPKTERKKHKKQREQGPT